MTFEIDDLILSTDVAHSGTSVRAVFEECVTRRVLGIPYCNDKEEIVGRVSVRHVLKETCIPDHLVQGAHLLGDLIAGLRIPNSMIRDILAMPVDEFVITPVSVVESTAPLVKIISIMEQQNTPYVFVVDEGQYRGVVTRMSCVESMLKIVDS